MTDKESTYVIKDDKIIPIYAGGWTKQQPEVRTFEEALESFLTRIGYIDAGFHDEAEEAWETKVIREIPEFYSANYLNPEEALFLLTGIMPDWAAYLFEWKGEAFYTMRPDFALQCILSNYNIVPLNLYEEKIRTQMLDYLTKEIEAIYRAIQYGELLSKNKKEEPFDIWMSFFQKRNFDISHIPEEYLSDPLSRLNRKNKALQLKLDETVKQCQTLTLENTNLKEGPRKNISERAERTYLNIIAALLEVISGESPGMKKHPNFNSEAKLIQHFVDFEVSGLSKSTLENKFSKAKRTFRLSS